jgi:hypothetical protein
VGPNSDEWRKSLALCGLLLHRKKKEYERAKDVFSLRREEGTEAISDVGVMSVVFF